jgi:hypothetical protein
MPANRWNQVGHGHWATIITWFRTRFLEEFDVKKDSELMKKIEKELNRYRKVLSVDVDLFLEFSPDKQQIIDEMAVKFQKNPGAWLAYRPEFRRMRLQD